MICGWRNIPLRTAENGAPEAIGAWIDANSIARFKGFTFFFLSLYIYRDPYEGALKMWQQDLIRPTEHAD